MFAATVKLFFIFVYFEQQNENTGNTFTECLKGCKLMIMYSIFMTPDFRISSKKEKNMLFYCYSSPFDFTVHGSSRGHKKCVRIVEISACTQKLSVQDYFRLIRPAHLEAIPTEKCSQMNWFSSKWFSLSQFVLVTAGIQNRSFYSSPLAICTY